MGTFASFRITRGSTLLIKKKRGTISSVSCLGVIERLPFGHCLERSFGSPSVDASGYRGGQLISGLHAWRELQIVPNSAMRILHLPSFGTINKLAFHFGTCSWRKRSKRGLRMQGNQ
jgi:hypothetical protein